MITVTPCNITVNQGDNVTIEAWSTCTRPEVTFSWRKDGGGMASYDFKKSCSGLGESYKKSTTTLSLTNVQPSKVDLELTYIHSGIGPENEPIICILDVLGMSYITMFASD